MQMDLRSASAVLDDRQAEEIERLCRQGVFDRATATRWIQQLLQDRREHVARLEYVRVRIRDAGDSLDGLCAATKSGAAVQVGAEQGGYRRGSGRERRS